jgi:hypothetical protein
MGAETRIFTFEGGDRMSVLRSSKRRVSVIEYEQAMRPRPRF